MRCPYCRLNDTKVIDSRLGAEGSEVRRRRSCDRCNERFTTFERLDRRFPQIIKRDNSLEDFNMEKIRRGIQRSVEKRAISAATIDSMVERIFDLIIKSEKEQIASDSVGNIILQELQKVDDVAYVRFASVYHRFESITDFMHALKNLNNNDDHKIALVMRATSSIGNKN